MTTTRGDSRWSECYRVNRTRRNYGSKSQLGIHTRSVMSETTAASTLIQYFPKAEIPEELEENIWAESRESQREPKEEFTGEEAYMSYYK